MFDNECVEVLSLIFFYSPPFSPQCTRLYNLVMILTYVIVGVMTYDTLMRDT